jgi:hypothetical protein
MIAFVPWPLMPHWLLVALIIAIMLIFLFFNYILVLSIIETVRQIRNPPPPQGLNFEAGLGMGGDLDVKLIKKQTK